MDVVLVSARSTGPSAHWSRALTAAVATILVGEGLQVRWLCPLAVDEPEPAVPAGARLDVLRARPAPFRAVLARVGDTALDVALARALRPTRRALVAHLGFGAAGSVNTLWLAERMGARPFAVVRAAEVLCHRGTLVDERGAACDRVLDAERCAACCCAASADGLSPQQATLARWLRPLGGWSPFPDRGAFLSRADLVLGSLLLANVVVGAAQDSERLQRAGLVARAIAVVGEVAGVPAAGAVAAAVLAQCAAVAS